MTRTAGLLGLLTLAAAACAAGAPPDEATPGTTLDAASIRRRQYTECRKYNALSETGLFERGEGGRMTETLAPGVEPFRPAHELWSDGATKRRWIRLPEGARIDTSDMDRWRFPKGTKLWKEFTRDGIRVETRLVEIGCDADPERPERGSGDFFFGAFVWGDDGEARLARDGLQDARGTPHDVPSQDGCVRCHAGEPGAVLGVSALQLSGGDLPLSLAALAARGALTHAPAREGYAIAGDAKARAALGWLHANCGHCHNDEGKAFDVVHQVLRSSVHDPEAVVRSIVDQPVQVRLDERTLRVKRGAPDESFVLFRITDPALRMPPGTELPSPEGARVVRAWIESLVP